mmetsp:Transcript_14505/g.29472  ORF Transcript_14505/g.29472 Transcript_14505/m.29472 type:complete len:137 (-) Transcript_14505:13-423(-)
MFDFVVIVVIVVVGLDGTREETFQRGTEDHSSFLRHLVFVHVVMILRGTGGGHVDASLSDKMLFSISLWRRWRIDGWRYGTMPTVAVARAAREITSMAVTMTKTDRQVGKGCTWDDCGLCNEAKRRAAGGCEVRWC